MKGLKSYKLWFGKPAREWNEALPIGNGTLGGMVFGRTDVERIQLNEDSLWYGGPVDRNNPDAKTHLNELRRLIFEGKVPEAEKLASKALVGMPDGQRHYEPLGDVYLVFDRLGEADDYRRELDLGNGIAAIEYTADRIRYRREIFSSYPDQVMAVRLTTDRPGRLTFGVQFGRGVVWDPDTLTDNMIRPPGIHAFLDRAETNARGDLVVRGRSGGEEGVRFCAVVRVVGEGKGPSTAGRRLSIEEADSATVLIAACTDFRVDQDRLAEECASRLDRAQAFSYEELRQRHIDDYRALYDRVNIDLRAEQPERERDLSGLPVDERLKRLREGETDVALLGLYYQFGRYLLIACSRPGSLPANLQGLWNADMLPIWDSKYTININTQMNYWPAESCNLGECHEPLFDMIERMRRTGRETARSMYGARGFMAHHNTDIWADTAPQDACITSTFWTMGAAWLCLHLWDRFDYGRDLAFLDRAYETMKEAALFLVDYLVESTEGELVVCPSSSPENRYFLPTGEAGTLCYGASMDSQIIRELFQRCMEASRLLGRDSAFADELGGLLSRIPAPAVGKHGQIREWLVDYDEPEPGHRHISHLFALHPGSQIDAVQTPELAAAASRTLERRLAHGGGHTGWSRAWILNMMARLGDGESAYAHAVELLRSSTLPNLFCDHPPFQIDGNFGGTAGLAEMLLQSHAGELRLLPALPKAIANGRISGLRARGGYEAEIEWRDGELTEAVLVAKQPGPCVVRYRGQVRTVELEAGRRTSIDPRTFDQP